MMIAICSYDLPSSSRSKKAVFKSIGSSLKKLSNSALSDIEIVNASGDSLTAIKLSMFSRLSVMPSFLTLLELKVFLARLMPIL